MKEKYIDSCKTEFWQNVFREELRYILSKLDRLKDILSIGCGPAIIEGSLYEHGFNIIGLDVSKEALKEAPDTIRTVVGSAEHMNFQDSSFDAVIYVASLQFIDDYKKAVEETARVLKSKGKLLVMLLNPESEFFRQKRKDPGSYINKIKHTDLREIEGVIKKYFSVETEYFLGINGKKVFDSQNPESASLYIVNGIKK